MTNGVKGTTPGRRYSIEPGSEIDRALAEAEAAGEPIELVHGEERYWLVPTTAHPREIDNARRKTLTHHSLIQRERQPPLDITTAQLIREGRGAVDGDQ